MLCWRSRSRHALPCAYGPARLVPSVRLAAPPPPAWQQAWKQACALSHVPAVAQGKLDIEAQCRGFLVLAKSAVAHLVGTIFGDSALAELFQKLYCSEDWQQGVTTGSILATLGDYFDDFKQLLEPTFFKRCANLACTARRLPRLPCVR